MSVLGYKYRFKWVCGFYVSFGINAQFCAYCEQSTGIDINGPFGFNQTPLATPGTKFIIHSKPSKQLIWDAHGLDGWCIGQSP